MEWNKEMTFRLIELYREKRILWDPMHAEYKNRSKKHSAWIELSKEMKIQTNEAEKKVRILVGQFQREIKKGKYEGDGTDASYKSKWIFFKPFLFLKDKTYVKEKTSNSIEENSLLKKSFKQISIESQDSNSNISLLIENDNYSNLQMKKQTKSNSNGIKRKADISEESHSVCPNELSNEIRIRDEFDVFGEIVAYSLRKLKNRTIQSHVKFNVYNILYRAEIENQQE
ncbi:uncharacterized protein LOC122717595 [Apis laboriosa]|uniref:uncharacterized protein LOC122717595 n=1 Tax=Apis laboriosa TaxID=183418 RepID=UPI001CC56FF1|nr:uncharacterized protein LOC122717595 [Apis laboriosa]